RFRLLETIRAYAAERLPAADRADLRRRHAEHFLAIAGDSKLLDGPGQAEVLDRLAAERANFRAAFDWAAEEGGDPALGLKLAIALQLFWHVRGGLAEGRRAFERLLRRPGTPPLLRGRALSSLGTLLGEMRDPRAVAVLEE